VSPGRQIADAKAKRGYGVLNQMSHATQPA
jgi:hypothetical protein